jgi:ABC-type multidrug transport system ATPase subunit
MQNDLTRELLIDSINKSYNNKNILQDIYLKINTGDIIGLLGRNGCGKSTLLKIVFGTLDAESKFIRINGAVCNSAFKNKNIKMLPQNNFLPKYLKVSSAIKLYCDKTNIDSVINDKTIQKMYTTRIRSVSGGELRYLEIKLLLAIKSDFILLDEPFNGVSPVLIEEIKKAIIERSGTAGIILTDHDYKNVLSTANKIYLMKNGSIKEMKTEEDIKEYGYIPK